MSTEEFWPPEKCPNTQCHAEDGFSSRQMHWNHLEDDAAEESSVQQESISISITWQCNKCGAIVDKEYLPPRTRRPNVS